MSKFTLFLKQNLPFASSPSSVELEDESILTNNVIFPFDEFNPHSCQLWVLGNEYGAIGAVWAYHEGDALDELINSGLGDGILIDEKDADDETARAGNASEPIDTEHLWMAPVLFDEKRDIKLIIKLAEARGACADNLSKV